MNATNNAFPRETVREEVGVADQQIITGDKENTKGTNIDKTRKKIRRGQARKNAIRTFKVLCNNVRGVKSKEETIKRIVSEENPVLVALVETKLDKNDAFGIDGYVTKRNDKDHDGGGVLLA